MKKIMFNDKYGLTKAVLDGRKTQTRRIVTYPKTFKGEHVAGFHVYKRPTDGFISEICMYDEDERDFDEGQIVPKYKIGEIVAIAQGYREIGYTKLDIDNECITKVGLDNKMFVKSELMPHQIHITNVRLQRLQDISDEDCLAEGIEYIANARAYYVGYNTKTGKRCWLGSTPKKAYAALIDKVSGKGTWDSNPYVWVYEFKLIK